jgi:hypothetical protein
MPRGAALVRTDVSEELIASIIKVTRIDELGTALAVTSNRSTLVDACHHDDGGETFLQNVGSYKSDGVTHQKTAFLIVTGVKTSNLT